MPLGLNQVGWIYLMGLGLPKDPVLAMRWYRRSAELGNANGAYELGWIYGHVDPVNYLDAMTRYRKAAAGQHVEAENNIGTLYEKGLGVTQDYSQAAHWDELASNVGYARSQFHLGALYFSGTGVKRDEGVARELIRKNRCRRRRRSACMVAFALM